MAQLRELPLTDLAAVRLDTEVDPRVLRQVRRVCERLRALVALVRFRLAHVHLRMELQVRLAPEDLKQTNERFHPWLFHIPIKKASLSLNKAVPILRSIAPIEAR